MLTVQKHTDTSNEERKGGLTDQFSKFNTIFLDNTIQTSSNPIKTRTESLTLASLPRHWTVILNRAFSKININPTK